MDKKRVPGKHLVMRTLTTLIFTVLPLGVTAQESSDDVRLEMEPRTFVCSLTKSVQSFDGDWSNQYNEDEDPRPKIVNIPSEDRPDTEWITDDGRFYRYTREQTDSYGRMYSSLHGTFDLRNQTLSTASAHFGTGQDGILRSYANSYFWVCSDMDDLG